MSPAVFVFLPFALMLLMAKGPGAKASTSEKAGTPESKVMGILTQEGDFIPLSSLEGNNEDNNESNNINATNSIVIEQNGKRYLLATVGEEG